MSEDNASKNRGKEMALPERLKFNKHGAMIFAETEPRNMMVADMPFDKRANHGETARVRGWGYLTGRGGGLGWSDEEAIAYQDRIGLRLVQCWNLLSGLSEAELEMLLQQPPHVIERALLEAAKADGGKHEES